MKRILIIVLLLIIIPTQVGAEYKIISEEYKIIDGVATKVTKYRQIEEVIVCEFIKDKNYKIVENKITPLTQQYNEYGLPIRELANLIEANVTWDPIAQKVLLVNENTYEFPIEAYYIIVNDNIFKLNNAVKLLEGTTYIQLEVLDLIGITYRMEENKLLIIK